MILSDINFHHIVFSQLGQLLHSVLTVCNKFRWTIMQPDWHCFRVFPRGAQHLMIQKSKSEKKKVNSHDLTITKDMTIGLLVNISTRSYRCNHRIMVLLECSYMLQNITWILQCFCGGKPNPDLSAVHTEGSNPVTFGLRRPYWTQEGYRKLIPVHNHLYLVSGVSRVILIDTFQQLNVNKLNPVDLVILVIQIISLWW